MGLCLFLGLMSCTKEPTCSDQTVKVTTTTYSQVSCPEVDPIVNEDVVIDYMPECEAVQRVEQVYTAYTNSLAAIRQQLEEYPNDLSLKATYKFLLQYPTKCNFVALE